MKLPAAEITEQTRDAVVLRLAVTPDLEAFEGHFPGRPILPGVVQVDWALRFGKMYLHLGETYAQDIQIKFKNVVTPDMLLLLTLEVDRDKGKLSFTYSVGEQSMSSGHMRLGAS